MSGRDAHTVWRLFAVESIPTKTATPQLDMFLDERPAAAAPGRMPTLLAIGCGEGRSSSTARSAR